MTVAELFAEVGLSPQGPKAWKDPIVEPTCGVYVVALVHDKDSRCSNEAFFLNSDESERWIRNEPIVYIGQTTKQTISKRIAQFYQHKYGNRSPHRGGQAVKLLLSPPPPAVPLDLWVYWAPTADPMLCEKQMLSLFQTRIGKLPYANRKKLKMQISG
jgi:hypothetical protein